ncbi:hypothetical protein [Phenylobacterium sp.]|uniref:hypothetical protein n=1 Tax=Phenylobacterium sp. TaxID=1871053 RepID=UPI0035B0DA1C
MTSHPFTSDEAVAEIAEGVIARTLPKARWTHAAHVAAAAWLVARRPDIEPERDMPGLIRAYNEATGGVNSDTEGYHETITQASLRAVRAGLAGLPEGAPVHVAVDALLKGELGRSDWLSAYWSKPVLFSVEARRGWVEPDLSPLPY